MKAVIKFNKNIKGMKICRAILFGTVILVCLSALIGIYLGKPNKMARGFDSDCKNIIINSKY